MHQHENLACPLADAPDVPPGLRGMVLNGPGRVTNLNIAKWDSWEAYATQFPLESDPDIETAPRQRALLDVIGPT